MKKPDFDPSLVRPLATVENHFLQVLVDRFRIRRKGIGFELQVAFNDESPSIWLRAAKRHILSTLPYERRAALQQSIDAFMASNEEVYNYFDPSFPFRLGNGGTLPVVRLKDADYYCLFYRDTHPTGWNIANGGANNRHDLLHPDSIVERELREELVIVEPPQGLRYVFDWHDASLRDHPDFALANERWAEHFRRQGFPEFEEVPLPLKWSLPPDADQQTVDQRKHDAMFIRCGNDEQIYTGQGFINLNAEDFGIEFDRIAKMSVGPEAVFCDGELHGRELLNRVVGLFEVGRIHKLIDQGEHQFIPDRTFWGGEDRTGDDPTDIIGSFLKERDSSWAKLEETHRINTKSVNEGKPLDLCPVTRTIIERHRKVIATERLPHHSKNNGLPFEIFLSFASEDRALAKTVFDHIAPMHNVFFSDVTMTSGAFADQIDHALDSSWAFVAVGSQVEHLNKSWVKYEWRNFHNDMNSGRKPKESPFFAFVSKINPNDLPRPLREQTAVDANPENITPALRQLDKLIGSP